MLLHTLSIHHTKPYHTYRIWFFPKNPGPHPGEKCFLRQYAIALKVKYGTFKSSTKTIKSEKGFFGPIILQLKNVEKTPFFDNFIDVLSCSNKKFRIKKPTV